MSKQPSSTQSEANDGATQAPSIAKRGKSATERLSHEQQVARDVYRMLDNIAWDHDRRQLTSKQRNALGYYRYVGMSQWKPKNARHQHPAAA